MEFDLEQLPKSDVVLLKSVLSKPAHELSADDIAILNARRQYLTYAQRQAYKGIIINDIDDENGNPPAQPQAQANQPTQWSDPQAQNTQAAQVAADENADTEETVEVADADAKEELFIPGTANPTETPDNAEGEAVDANEENPYDVKDPSTLA